MSENIKEIIEAAVGLTWAHFKARHPSQAAAIERTAGGKPIVPEVIELLESGDDYDDLVARTAAEADVARVAETIAPIVMNALMAILGA